MTNLLPRLSILLPVCIAIWAISCFVNHGPAIVLYIGLHLATSGVFAFMIWKAERTAMLQKQALAAQTPAAERKVSAA